MQRKEKHIFSKHCTRWIPRLGEEAARETNYFSFSPFPFPAGAAPIFLPFECIALKSRRRWRGPKIAFPNNIIVISRSGLENGFIRVGHCFARNIFPHSIQVLGLVDFCRLCERRGEEVGWGEPRCQWANAPSFSLLFPPEPSNQTPGPKRGERREGGSSRQLPSFWFFRKPGGYDKIEAQAKLWESKKILHKGLCDFFFWVCMGKSCRKEGTLAQEDEKRCVCWRFFLLHSVRSWGKRPKFDLFSYSASLYIPTKRVILLRGYTPIHQSAAPVSEARFCRVICSNFFMRIPLEEHEAGSPTNEIRKKNEVCKKYPSRDLFSFSSLFSGTLEASPQI